MQASTNGWKVGSAERPKKARACLRAALVGTVLWSAAISAEDSTDSAAGDSGGDAEMQEVHVTGSRVARTANDTPTPVTTIGQEQIRAQGPQNIADFVNTLPSVRGSSTATNSAGSLSNGLAGISALNLRALGTGRTLVLFDGQRSVVSASTGQVDTNCRSSWQRASQTLRAPAR